MANKDSYEELISLIREGLDDVAAGNIAPLSEVIAEIKAARGKTPQGKHE